MVVRSTEGQQELVSHTEWVAGARSRSLPRRLC